MFDLPTNHGIESVYCQNTEPLPTQKVLSNVRIETFVIYYHWFWAISLALYVFHSFTFIRRISRQKKHCFNIFVGESFRFSSTTKQNQFGWFRTCPLPQQCFRSLEIMTMEVFATSRWAARLSCCESWSRWSWCWWMKDMILRQSFLTMKV